MSESSRNSEERGQTEKHQPRHAAKKSCECPEISPNYPDSSDSRKAFNVATIFNREVSYDFANSQQISPALSTSATKCGRPLSMNGFT